MPRSSRTSKKLATRLTSAEFVRLPNDTKPVTPEQRETLAKLIDKLEEDEDVQNVFTNMQEEEEEEA